MYLEPGWCQLCYVMIRSWLWTKFTKGKLLYRVYIYIYIYYITLELCFSSRWLLEQSGAKPQDVASCFILLTVSVHVGSPLCFPSTFSCMKIWKICSQNNFQCNFHFLPFKSCLFLYLMNFTKLHEMPLTQWRNDAAADSPRSWGKVISLRSILDSVTKPMTPLPSLQHCLCSSSLRAQTVKGFDMKN